MDSGQEVVGVPNRFFRIFFLFLFSVLYLVTLNCFSLLSLTVRISLSSREPSFSFTDSCTRMGPSYLAIALPPGAWALIENPGYIR